MCNNIKTIISNAVTLQKQKIFIEEIYKGKNGATFQRRINKTIVRACFRVHTKNNRHVPVYTLTFSADDNPAGLLVEYYIYRDVNLHDIIKDFKNVINGYMCALT